MMYETTIISTSAICKKRMLITINYALKSLTVEEFRITLHKNPSHVAMQKEITALLVQLSELAFVSVIPFKNHFLTKNFSLSPFMLLACSGHQYHFLSSQLIPKC